MKKKNFKFHPRCKKLQILQLGFADDLLLLYKGELKSVKLLIQHFQHFSQMSGLVANVKKSSVYFGGVQQNILHAIHFNKGEMRFRYFRIPKYKKATYCAIQTSSR